MFKLNGFLTGNCWQNAEYNAKQLALANMRKALALEEEKLAAIKARRQVTPAPPPLVPLKMLSFFSPQTAYEKRQALSEKKAEVQRSLSTLQVRLKDANIMVSQRNNVLGYLLGVS